MLEADNPATGKLCQPIDFNAINWNDVGTAMLQDAFWATTDKLTDPAYEDTTVKFIEASIQGWAYCRDTATKCRDIVVAKGSKDGNSHQLWQVNEINKLVWPSAKGAGWIDPADWALTALKAQGVDVVVSNFTPLTVTLQPGGN